MASEIIKNNFVPASVIKEQGVPLTLNQIRRKIDSGIPKINNGYIDRPVEESRSSANLVEERKAKKVFSIGELRELSLKVVNEADSIEDTGVPVVEARVDAKLVESKPKIKEVYTSKELRNLCNKNVPKIRIIKKDSYERNFVEDKAHSGVTPVSVFEKGQFNPVEVKIGYEDVRMSLVNMVMDDM